MSEIVYLGLKNILNGENRTRVCSCKKKCKHSTSCWTPDRERDMKSNGLMQKS
jgi:hypothetical protein